MKPITITLLLLSICLKVFGQSGITNGNTISISGQIETHNHTDTVVLQYWEGDFSPGGSAYSSLPSKEIKTAVNGNLFEFIIEAPSEIVFFCLYTTETNDLNNYEPLGDFLNCFLLPGDNIQININEAGLIHYSGQGSEKLNLFNELRRTLEHIQSDYFKMLKNKQLNNQESRVVFAIINKERQYWNVRKLIQQYSTRLKPIELQLVQVTVVSKFLEDQYRMIRSRLRVLNSQIQDLNNNDNYKKAENSVFDDGFLRSLYSHYESYFEEMINEHSDVAIINSPRFIELVETKYKIDLTLGLISDISYFDYVGNKYTGLLSERLITYYLLGRYNYLKSDVEKQLDSAISSFETDKYRDLLREMKRFSNRGNLAYNFTLLNEQGKEIHLSDFKGKHVFIDYWFTGCSACASYYTNTFSKVIKAFEGNKDIIFLSISADKDRAVWERSIKSGQYTSDGTNVVNLYTNGLGSKHPFVIANKMTGAPSFLFIDPESRILQANGLQLPYSELVTLIKEYLNQ
ncbi:TlpA family protein disulfide reductase [Sphingobacterium humi]|uniref:Redoxin domain-containing protein n=1 Tax=Sphingobacterium humi TaxID=1796905 RepID=A0A6N8L7N7_9SPHI|nr:redoxin domain-containing protein [Sphingobacterium humi]MVZ63762.1 redoxin domain-containing protein [Sphingobacterium humi]